MSLQHQNNELHAEDLIPMKWQPALQGCFLVCGFLLIVKGPVS